MDLISIIVPVYKAESYLDDCLKSITCQTYSNLEIILVDDGSPDHCPEMCEDWAKKDERIKVIHQKNGGAAAARNAGLEIARGDYIGFVDSDDMVRPDKYEILLNALRDSDKGIACCFSGWDPNMPYEAAAPQILEMGVEETVNSILSGRVGTSVWRRLYRRDIWQSIRFPVGEVNEDYPPLIPTAIAAGGMVEVREKLHYYRQTPNSVTATYWQKNADIVLKNIRRIQNQIEENHLNCMTEFQTFVVRTAYSVCIALDKHLPELNESAREAHRQYLQLMRSRFFRALVSKTLTGKDKVLYTLIVMRVLRPVYRLVGKL